MGSELLIKKRVIIALINKFLQFLNDIIVHMEMTIPRRLTGV